MNDSALAKFLSRPACLSIRLTLEGPCITEDYPETFSQEDRGFCTALLLMMLKKYYDDKYKPEGQENAGQE